jgi:hypothetical protein
MAERQYANSRSVNFLAIGIPVEIEKVFQHKFIHCSDCKKPGVEAHVKRI